MAVLQKKVSFILQRELKMLGALIVYGCHTHCHNKPIGIITERDLVRKVCVNGKSSSSRLL